MWENYFFFILMLPLSLRFSPWRYKTRSSMQRKQLVHTELAVCCNLQVWQMRLARSLDGEGWKRRRGSRLATLSCYPPFNALLPDSFTCCIKTCQTLQVLYVSRISCASLIQIIKATFTTSFNTFTACRSKLLSFNPSGGAGGVKMAYAFKIQEYFPNTLLIF